MISAMASVIVFRHPTTKITYEVFFRDGEAEAVARHRRGRKPIDVWWNMRGEPSSHVLKIIDLAINIRNARK